MNNSIIFDIQSETGIINLDRPKALNALDLEMAELFFSKLSQWKKDKKIKRVLLKGEGKAFCAGGDIKSMFLSSGVSDLKKNFLFKEYKLNYAISQFTKAISKHLEWYCNGRRGRTFHLRKCKNCN